jgi:FkbM family methyltransferase
MLKFMNYYFPSKLIRQQGLRALPFVVSSLPLYLLFDIFCKITDSTTILRLKSPVPIILFTPTSRIIPCPFMDLSTVAILHEIYAEEIYRKLPHYEPKAGWAVIDAGANVGLFSLYTVDHGRPKLVIALEPVPKNYQRLTLTLKANAVNVTALRYALSDKSGFLEFMQSNDSATSHIVFSGKKDSDKKTIHVRGISLSNIMTTFNLTQIDLLKLDIEGAEYSVISSSTHLLKTGRIKRIVGELHGELKDFDKLVCCLEVLGFKIEYLIKCPPVAFIHAKHSSAN